MVNASADNNDMQRDLYPP